MLSKLLSISPISRLYIPQSCGRAFFRTLVFAKKAGNKIREFRLWNYFLGIIFSGGGDTVIRSARKAVAPATRLGVNPTRTCGRQGPQGGITRLAVSFSEAVQGVKSLKPQHSRAFLAKNRSCRPVSIGLKRKCRGNARLFPRAAAVLRLVGVKCWGQAGRIGLGEGRKRPKNP